MENNNLLQNLNPAQKEAVTHNEGPLLIVAGAGTGKTTVITERIAYLIGKNLCKPEEILALTFTDKAAGEMEERVDRALPYGYIDLWISTFHAYCEKILKERGLEIGLPNDFKLLNTTQQWLLMRQNLDCFDLNYYRPLGDPSKFIHALISHFSRAKDENIAPEEYLKYAEDLKLNSDSAEFARTVLDEKTLEKLSAKEKKEIISGEITKVEEVANAYHTYQQILLENNALDFGDLINYTLKLFKERKNVLNHYRKQFKYILVDEFQDTNYAQYELVKLLSAPKNNITVVGDDDQAIYKFRGASISNIIQFKDDYPGAKEIFLNTNYRSRQEILDLSYEFIKQNNPYRLEVKLSKGDKKLSKKLDAFTKDGGEIVHLHGATLEDEVKITIEKIIELYNQDKELQWSDFAILVRANNSAKEFIYILEKAGIPFSFVASKGLYGKQLILDILAYLKLLDNYHEGSAMYRILSMPTWRIEATDIINLNYWSRRKGLSLYETCKKAGTYKNISAPTQKAIIQILGLIERHTQLARDGKKTTEIMQAFLEDSQYLEELTREDSQFNREQLNYLNQFYKKARDFEQDSPHNTVGDFLELLELELEAGEEGSLRKNLEDEGPDTLKIMTIHGAKGLEFKYVFIANMVDRKFPSTSRRDAIELPDKLVKEIIPEGDIHLQEERRLFYVAMTRAKEKLFLTSAEDYGGARKKKLSRFITELVPFGFKLSDTVSTETKEQLFKQQEKIKQRESLPIKELMPSKFSFTQVKAYESCPYQYRFSHILRVPTRGKPQFSFGKSMHSALQKFFQTMSLSGGGQTYLFGAKENYQPKLDDLLKFYEESFIDDWYPDKITKEKYFTKGKKALKDFFELHKDNWPRVKFLEYPFNLHIQAESGGRYTFYGMIDRVDKVEDGIKIIDYKTGKSKTKLTLEQKEQLLLYQMAVEEVLGEKVKELAFYYLEDNKEVAFLGSEKELEKVKNKFLGIISQIEKGDFPPTPGMVCQWCDFNRICDFRTKS